VKRWGPAVVALGLLAATAVAFATTERQKLEKTPFAVVRVDEVLSPVCRCSTNGATIALRFRRTHVLTVQILDAGGRVVRTLAEERTVRDGVFDVRWLGRDDSGRRVTDGEYEPRFVLDNGRTFDPPNPIRVDSVAPTAKLLSVEPRRVRRGERVRIRYHVTEEAHPTLFVDGRRVVVGNAKALTAQFQWFARLRRGRHRLRLAAVDLAGNVGPRTRPVVVRIRR
jgi:flagellar hook capping protein FlgD